MSANDHELKIFEKYSCVRRMPLTEDAEKWLNDKEKSRAALYEEKVRTLREEYAAKSDKGKGGDKDKGKKDDKGKKAKGAVVEAPAVKPKYKSAAQFMRTFFPVFDAGNAAAAEGTFHSLQEEECPTEVIGISQGR